MQSIITTGIDSCQSIFDISPRGTLKEFIFYLISSHDITGSTVINEPKAFQYF